MTLDDGEILIRRLAALSEARQRVAVLAEEAERLGMDNFADLLAVVVSRASEHRREQDSLALAAAMDYLDSDYLDEGRRVELLEACREHDHRQLLRLLFSPSDHRKTDTEQIPDYGAGRPLTLGERKSLARRPSRHIVERVVADPHPDVIRNLLRNPKLTELDVMRLVSRRPNYEKVLREVYSSTKWARRYGIKVALARNPYTPPSLALKILPQLMHQDLSEMLQDRGLHPSVLVSCRRLLEGEDQAGESRQDDDETIH